MIIRTAKKDDLKGLLELYKYLFVTEDYTNFDEFKEKWDTILGHNGLEYFMVIEGEKIVASCNIAILPNLSRGQKSYALIENVISHPDYRRKGYGKAVVEEAIEYAKRENCYKVMLLSTASHERKVAHQFYENLGFNGDDKRGFYIKFSES